MNHTISLIIILILMGIAGEMDYQDRYETPIDNQ